jgi:hypothetical protein
MMKHSDFKNLAQKMFDGQFPNEIIMRKPDLVKMTSPEYDIREELKEWINVTIDKYKELVAPSKE